MPTHQSCRVSAPVRRWAYPGAVPLVDQEELDILRADLRDIEFELLLVKRDLAWNRVIDDAIVVCRLLGQLEAETARKYRADQPRVPAGNADGGQWTEGGGGEGAGSGATAANVGATAAADGATLSAEAAQRALQRLAVAAARVAGTAATLPLTVATAGVLIAMATPAGEARQIRVETLADGTVVTVESDELLTRVRGESPDGKTTYATITIDQDGSPRVLRGAVQRPGRDPEEFDPAAMTAATAGLLNAATGGDGKSGPKVPDRSGIAATPPPEDFEPDETSKQTRLPTHLRNKVDRIENATAAGGRQRAPGSVSGKDARLLGEKFVGRGYRVTRGQKGEEILISRDGLRQYRGPTGKTGTNKQTAQPWSKTGREVNFESRTEASGAWQNNVHLDIK